MHYASKRAKLIAFSVLLPLVAFGQGTIVFDQQSSIESNTGEGAASVNTYQPLGQSFTPSLPGVGLIRIWLGDYAFDGVGTTVFINLRANSITSAVLAATAPLFLPDGFHGASNFFFAAEVTVTPGTTYYFQPVIQSGADFATAYDARFNYAGGTAFFNGTADQFDDLWFREGIMVPEPSAIALLFLGAAGLCIRFRRPRK